MGLYNDGLKEFRILHGKTPLAIELSGLLYTPIKNHRGDICQLLTFQGPAAVYRYNAFGLYSYSGTIDSPWLFSSQRYDQSTLLYHFDKREYDPTIGRWLTPDPLGFADGPNLYAYVKNNPLIYVDPYGLFWTEAGEFSHGFTRGFCDDTTLGGSSYLCGNYHSPSTLGTWGYRAGTGTSIAAGLLYGGTEVRLLKGAATGLFLSANKIRQSWLACNQATTTAKALHETHQVAKLASETAVPTILKVSQTAERSAIAKETDKILTKTILPEGHIWQKASPFKHRSAKELNEMFIRKGYEPLGKDCIKGYGNYINPKNGRQYHIDPKNIGRYREPNHVDVSRSDNYEGLLDKKRFFYEDD